MYAPLTSNSSTRRTQFASSPSLPQLPFIKPLPSITPSQLQYLRALYRSPPSPPLPNQIGPIVSTAKHRIATANKAFMGSRLMCCRGLSACLSAAACLALFTMFGGPILIVVGIVLITTNGGDSDHSGPYQHADDTARDWGIGLLIAGCVILALSLVVSIVLCCVTRRMRKEQTIASANTAPDFVPPPQPNVPYTYDPSNAAAPPFYQNQPMPPPQPQQSVPSSITPYGYSAQRQHPPSAPAPANAFSQLPPPTTSAPAGAGERPYFYPGPSNAVEGVVVQPVAGSSDHPNPYGAGNCTYT